MYSTTDFKKGLKIEIDGVPFELLEHQHHKPGKGGAIVRTRLRNLFTKRIHDQTFRSGEKVEKADIEMREMQYLYREGDDLIIMDLTSYEQIHFPAEDTNGKSDFCKDGEKVFVLLYNGKPIDLEVPLSMIFEIVHTEPGLKGDTVSNATKPATIETGAVIQVPLFVNTGDKVKVDTRSREYLGRE